MPTVQNYLQQNYNAPIVQAIPAQNFMSNIVTLGSDTLISFCHADLLVIFKGGPGTTNGITPAIPSGQLNLRMDVTFDQPGATIYLQEDLGDGIFTLITPAPILCGAGLTKILIQLTGKLFRARVLRAAGIATAMTWHSSFIGY